jgi:hypothetical protein
MPIFSIDIGNSTVLSNFITYESRYNTRDLYIRVFIQGESGGTAETS